MTETYKEKLIKQLPIHLQHTAKRDNDNLFLADVVEELNRLRELVQDCVDGWWECVDCGKIFWDGDEALYELVPETDEGLCHDCAQARGWV